MAVQFDDEYLGGFAAPPLDDPYLTLSPSSLLHEGSLPGLGACSFLAEYATDRHRRMPGVEELANWVMSRKSLDEAMFLTLMQRDGETRNRLVSRVASLWTFLGDGLSIFQAIDYSAAMNPHVHAILWNCRHAAPFIEDAWLRVLRVPDRMTRYAQARPLRGVGGVYYCAIRAVGYADWDVIGPGWGADRPGSSKSVGPIGPTAKSPGRPKSAIHEARSWLWCTLCEGPRLRADIDRLAAGQRLLFSKRTLERAVHDLGVTSKRTGFGRGASYSMLLPPGVVPPRLAGGRAHILAA